MAGEQLGLRFSPVMVERLAVLTRDLGMMSRAEVIRHLISKEYDRLYGPDKRETDHTQLQAVASARA